MGLGLLDGFATCEARYFSYYANNSVAVDGRGAMAGK